VAKQRLDHAQVRAELTRIHAPEDAPPFRIYRPEAERDRAIAALVAYLRAHAGR
jgi:hypothetical protein